MKAENELERGGILRCSCLWEACLNRAELITGPFSVSLGVHSCAPWDSLLRLLALQLFSGISGINDTTLVCIKLSD